MRTWIRLKGVMGITDDNTVYDFIRQYGWSIVLFDEDRTKNSTFAAILDDIPTTRDSQLESLRFLSKYFNADGFDRLDSIIERSPNFKDLGLCVVLYDASDLEKGQSMFNQHGSVLSVLQLRSQSLYKWLPQIASSFPTRNSFPNMVSLVLVNWSGNNNLPSSCVPWIVAMVSAPPQATALSLHLESPSQGIVDNARGESESTRSWTALKKIKLLGVKLQPKEWKTVIKAIDLSELQYLNLEQSNITYEAFKLLVDRIPDNNTSKVPFKTLDIKQTDICQTDIAEMTDSRAAILQELRRKAPLIKIITF
ncbi:hypothetical protein BGZ65_008726 [Modicella reniformis]|uniref:Uncharacterized protein n=1 Tax=Modicella reniformis TaxID=1440133 RepID=A0A9P6IU73_9FUNG|nr:hypothetical protein BGZ65_008726 [Modicella reniformis]